MAYTKYAKTENLKKIEAQLEVSAKGVRQFPGVKNVEVSGSKVTIHFDIDILQMGTTSSYVDLESKVTFDFLGEDPAHYANSFVENIKYNKSLSFVIEVESEPTLTKPFYEMTLEELAAIPPEAVVKQLFSPKRPKRTGMFQPAGATNGSNLCLTGIWTSSMLRAKKNLDIELAFITLKHHMSQHANAKIWTHYIKIYKDNPNYPQLGIKQKDI